MKKIEILDSTLRDGAQGAGISFSLTDKLKILSALDAFGIDFIEGGNPASNPKDLSFFECTASQKLKSGLAAFGATKRRDVLPEDDEGLQALIKTNTEYAVIFGKSHALHVERVLGVKLAENLEMIERTAAYLTKLGKRVIFDAEHFFDGYKHNAEYAIMTLEAAQRAGAYRIVLCDTNGGSFPDEIKHIIHNVLFDVNTPVGIHCHNDNGCAVANSIAAVNAGCVQVHGTFIGIGERCGNANLSTVIADLQLRLGYECVPEASMPLLKETARFIAQTANLTIPGSMPYVGGSAFAHKGGMHIDGVVKESSSYEHIQPESVGNEREYLLSEVSGRAALLAKLRKIDAGIDKNDDIVRTMTGRIKTLEHQGYQFEAAEASFELLVLKEFGRFEPYFEIVDYKIISSNASKASASIKVRVGEKYEITAEEGDGPVNAVDRALRKALGVFYPCLSDMQLTDYKVRIVDDNSSTAATTRVLIESTDKKTKTGWTTVGAGKDIINASMLALADSLEYMLYINREEAL